MNTPTRNPRQHSAPVHVDRLEPNGIVRALDRIRFERTAGDKNTHDEFWLQSLLFRFPACLPLSEIDTGVETLVPVCMELPLPSGFLDNLYVTVDGDLVLVECKLWRNPEARREVVAQIIDYAHSMSAWSYEDLDQAVRKGIVADKTVLGKSLLEVASINADLDESTFVDAVSRNLKLGRFLLLVVGDGIREGAETLAQCLQSHAGFHFTLSLLEMPVFHAPGGGYVVTPRLLARTMNIERGIVRVTDGKAVVDPVPAAAIAAGPRTSLSQERITEAISAAFPGFLPAFQAFLAAGENEGLFTESATKSLMVRFLGSDESTFTAGGFGPDGTFWTYTANWRPGTLGLLDISHQYLEDVARVIGGSVRRTPKPEQWYVVTKNGETPKAMDILRHSDDWLGAIATFSRNLRAAMQRRED